MEARDFRSIGRPAQEALRRRALFLIEHQGLTQAAAAQAVGVQRQTVSLGRRRYREQGEDGVLDGRRVSPRRGKGLLAETEARQVQAWIADKTPDQLKLPWALWTSRAVRDLIERQFGKRLGLSTVQLYLQRWGMTPQKPLAGPGSARRQRSRLGWSRTTRRSPSAPRPSGPRSTGATRPASRTRTRSAAPTPPRARPRSSSARPSGSPGA